MEVVPLDREGEFECPRCQERCVECPYESFENWAGTWTLRFGDGPASEVTIAEDGGVLVRSGTGQSADSAQLVWAPFDHEGFLMRLDGRLQGLREHLRPDPELGGITIRSEGEDGVVTMGKLERALPGGFASGRPTSVVGAVESFVNGLMEAMGGMEDVEDQDMTEAGGTDADGDPGDMHRAVHHGFHHLAHWHGLTGSDEEHMRQHLQQLTAPLVRDLEQLRQLGQMVHLGEHGAFAHAGAAGMPFAFNLTQLLTHDLGMNSAGQRAERGGVPEATAAAWLESRRLSPSEVEPDWHCPICFDSDTSTREELVAVCQDEQGHANHVFHKQCVQDWLIRRNECPSCRRTPVVVPLGPDPAG